MAYISQYEYYDNNGVAPEDKNWGSYQYVSLYDIVNNLKSYIKWDDYYRAYDNHSPEKIMERFDKNFLK